jgi:hypothetical protein
MLLAREGYVRAMDCVSSYKVQNFGILLAGGPKSAAACGNVIKQIFDL